MTKKLNWRLSELPNASEVADLVEQEVITKEEARDILFKTKDESDKDQEVKSLREQVEFLERVVDTLSRKQSTTITYTPSYPTRYWRWNETSPMWCSTSTSMGGGLEMSVNTGNLLK